MFAEKPNGDGAMGKYEELGPTRFWEEYGKAVKEADERIVMPVLSKLGAKIGDKWCWDGRGYPFWIDTRGYEVRFDVEEVPVEGDPSATNRFLRIELRTHTTEGYLPLGEMDILLPMRDGDVVPQFVFAGNLAQAMRQREEKNF